MAEERNAPKDASLVNPRPVRTWLMVLAVVILLEAVGAIAIRHLTFTRLSVDFVDYYGPAAESILQGKGPRLADESIMVHYPPAYPFYAAGLMWFSGIAGGSLDTWIVGGNLLWNALTVSAVYLLGWRLEGKRLAICSAMMAGLLPQVVYMTKTGFVQIPYLAFLAWAVYCLHRGRTQNRFGYFVLAGMLFGAAGLFRPAVLVLLAVLVLYLLVFFRGKILPRIIPPLLVSISFLVIIAPWSAYVYAREGKTILLADVAESHFSGTAQADAVSDDPTGIRGVRHFRALLDNPVKHSLNLIQRAIKTLYRTDGRRYEKPTLAVNLFLLTFFVIGATYALRRPWRWTGGILIACLLASWILPTLTIYLARYLATGFLLSIPVTAAGVLWTFDRWRQRQGSAK